MVWDCGEATHRRRGIDWPGDHRSDGVSIQLNCCPTLFLILIHLLFFFVTGIVVMVEERRFTNPATSAPSHSVPSRC